MTEARPTPPAHRSPAWLREAGLGLLLLACTLAAYFPALHGGVIIDDQEHLTAPALRSLAGLGRIWSVLGATHQYYPILHTAFWLEHRLWGDGVFGYHLTNVLLHAGSALLLVAIVRRLGLPGGWLAAFIFALHPVCVESVAWIAEQKNTLSTVFCLASALVYLRYDERRRAGAYAAALGLFILAVLSKTATSPLPAALLVILWWRRGRLGWKRDVGPLIPWFLAAGAAVIPTGILERRFCAPYAADLSLSWVQRFLLAGRAFWFYLGKLVWPVHLCFVYPRWSIDPSDARLYLFPVGALVLLAGLGWLARLNRGPLAAVLLFAGILFPVLGFINLFWFVLSWVGDHLQYLACLSLVVLFAAGATRAVRRFPPGLHRFMPVAGAALAAVLGILTWRQSRLYRNAETLYRATLVRNPACWMAHYNLGYTWYNLPGRRADVIAEWKTAVRYEPAFADAQNNLGCLLAADPARASDAITCFEAAIRQRPDLADAHNNLGCLLENLPGRLPEAVIQFEAAVRYDPTSAEAQNNLGNLLMDDPRRALEGIRNLEAAVSLKSDYTDARWNLAIALSRIPKRWPEAIADLQTLLSQQAGQPGLEAVHQLLNRLQAAEQARAHPGTPPVPVS